jgi:hypothetical protein
VLGLYRAKTRSQARDLKVDPSTGAHVERGRGPIGRRRSFPRPRSNTVSTMSAGYAWTQQQWDELVDELGRLSGDPWRRLLDEHTSSADGLCRGCGRPGYGVPFRPWPCTLRRIAEQAAPRHITLTRAGAAFAADGTARLLAISDLDPIGAGGTRWPTGGAPYRLHRASRTTSKLRRCSNTSGRPASRQPATDLSYPPGIIPIVAVGRSFDQQSAPGRHRDGGDDARQPGGYRRRYRADPGGAGPRCRPTAAPSSTPAPPIHNVPAARSNYRAP